MFDSVTEAYLTFAEEHYMLALGIRILISIALFVIAIRIVGFICSLLYAAFDQIVGLFNKANAGLDKVCAPCGKSSNPWGMVLSLFPSVQYAG